MSDLKLVGRRIDHGGPVSILTAITIKDLLTIVEIPDPNRPFEDNRRVNKNHASSFGDYWETQPAGWIIPPLLLDTEQDLTILESPVLPHTVTLDLDLTGDKIFSILDGQHRVLGWHLKIVELKKRLHESNSAYNRAVFSNDQVLLESAKDDIRKINYQLDRIANEYIGVTLLIGLQRDQHRQFFVDIASNALGINKTVQAKFDNSSIVNRVAQELISTHPLLIGRIDLEKTKCNGNNPNFLSVVNITDIVRHLAFGINTRVSKQRELKYDDNEIYNIGLRFFDSLEKNSNLFQKLAEGEITSEWLRNNSLLASGTILRCLAGMYYETCVVDINSNLSIDSAMHRDFEEFVKNIDSNSKLPISANWYATNLFAKRSSLAPSSRTQDLRDMTDLFVLWSQNGEMFNPRKKGKKAK